MALDSNLLKFKSAGTKILTEIVENIPQAEMPQGTRILVINSKKGRVNTLVRKDTFTDYLSEFDGISDADERRGNWGARSAEYMLRVAPIYVLNLREFDDTIDKAGYHELSTTLGTSNEYVKDKPYSKLFNTTQMWKVDPSVLVSTSNIDHLLTFANIGTKNLSLFVRKTRTLQSSVTLETFYKQLGRELPSYVYGKDLVSDWYIDVVIFNNTFTNPQSNQNYGYLFNADGTIKKEVTSNNGVVSDGITELTKIAESGYVGTITGSMIQGFMNDRNQSQDIIELINASYPQTGLIASRNESIFDSASIWYEGETPNSNEMKKPIPFDLKGHTICNINQNGAFAVNDLPQSVETLSYKYDIYVNYDEINTKNVNEYDVTFTNKSAIKKQGNVIKYNGYLKGNKVGNNVELVAKNVAYFFGDDVKPTQNSTFVGFDGNLAKVTNIRVVSTATIVTDVNTFDFCIAPLKEMYNGTQDTKSFYSNKGKELDKTSNGYYVYPQGHKLQYLPICFVNDGGVPNGYYNLPSADTDFILDPRVPYTKQDMVDIIQGLNYTVDNTVINSDMFTQPEWFVGGLENELNDILAKHGKFNNVYEVTFDKDLALNSTLGEDVEVELEPKTLDVVKHEILDTNLNKIYVYDEVVIYEVLGAEQSSVSYKPLNLKSYVPRVTQFLDGTADRQTSVLNVLTQENIKNALANRDLYSWQYIVDGFKSYIEPNVKSQLKDVAKERIVARAIYNMPSIYEFSRSTNPYFADSVGGVFKPKYIAMGGNLELPHNNIFSLSSVDGWYSYGFGPNLTLSGSTKTMPPASIVSNLFQNKYLIGKPYMILAGSDQGAIRENGISGVEYTFNESNNGDGDRDYLEPFGYNVILNKRSGLQIYSNKTSQNTVNTPVSSIHTSEVLMQLQIRINEMLENFVFKINNSQNRMIIKKQADDICQEALDSGAISGYKNQMDTVNNTREVIANRIGILDTTLYDSNGMEILVHRTKMDTLTNMTEFSVL